MTLLKYIFIFLCIININSVAFCQETKPLPFDTAHTTTIIPNKWSDVRIMEITGQELLETINKNGKILNWVILYSSGCSGTKYAVEYANEMIDTHGDSIGVYMLAGDSYSNINSIKKELYKNKCAFQSYIISNTYGSYKNQTKTCLKIRK